jgi:pimeloyl-ACP methyl ester carboxylesterase
MALERPERVRSIVLGGLGGNAMAFAGLYFRNALFSRQHLALAGPSLSRRFALRNDYLARYTDAQFEALARDPLRLGALEVLRLPVLIVVGEHDTAQGDYAAFTVTASLAERIPGAKRIVIAGTDHATCAGDERSRP